MLKFIPNLLTLGNLFCGCLSVIFILQGQLKWIPLLIGLAAFLDFFDGFAARLLKVSGPLGKELDSLADMISFGLVPGLIVYHYFQVTELPHPWLAYFGLIITLASCYRLAAFNISTDQSEEFIGVPTPATTLFFLSFPLLDQFNPDSKLFSLITNTWVLLGITLIFTYLLNAKLRLIALKFKGFGFKGDNVFRYALLIGVLLIFLIFKWEGLPISIIYYILLSIIRSITKKASLS